MKVLRLLALACALFAVNGCSDVDSSEEAGGPPYSGTLWEQLDGSTGAAKVDVRELERAFPVFRSPEEAPPPKVRAHLERTLRAPQEDFVIRTAQELREGRPLWLIRVGPIVCLIDEVTGALSCTRAEEFEIRGLSLGIVGSAASSSGGRFSTIGVVPAHVREVVVKLGPDRRRVLRVRKGRYSASSGLPVLVTRYCEDAGSCQPVPLGPSGN